MLKTRSVHTLFEDYVYVEGKTNKINWNKNIFINFIS